MHSPLYFILICFGRGSYGGGKYTPLCSNVSHLTDPSRLAFCSSHHLYVSASSSSFLALLFFAAVSESSSFFAPFFLDLTPSDASVLAFCEAGAFFVAAARFFFRGLSSSELSSSASLSTLTFRLPFAGAFFGGGAGTSSSDSTSGSDSDSCFTFFLGGLPLPFAGALPLPLTARLGFARGASSSSSSSSSDSMTALLARGVRFPFTAADFVVVACTAPGIRTAADLPFAGDKARGLSSSLDDSETTAFLRLRIRVSGVMGSDLVRVV